MIGSAPGNSPIDFQHLFDNAPDLYLVLDPDLIIVGVTKAYARATKIEKEQALGKGIFEIFPDNPNDPASEGVRNLHASLRRVLQTSQPDAMLVQKYDIRKPENEGGGFEERYWSPINTPVLDNSGNVICIIHKVEDVTDFVKLKQQGVAQDKLNESLREHAVRMENEIFARSREVAEASAKLKNANEELESLYTKSLELDKLKSQFFANVSHELRTPLTLILSPLESRLRKLKESGSSPAEYRDIEIMLRNARLLYRHVSDLLDASKLEAGKMIMIWSQVDLARAVSHTAHDFDSLAAERNIRYTITVPSVLTAEIDAEKLQRILLNLLSNAFKFTPANGEICVAIHQDRECAVLEITDNGPGIPDELKSTVFERFRQIDGGIQRQHGGTGLGLAIVRDFVELHQGTICVQDAPDGGCRFSIRLPLRAPLGAVITGTVEPKNDLLKQVVEELSLHQNRDEQTQGESSLPLILVVEDNVDMNDYLVGLLSPQYRIARAFDGREGLEKATALIPDLILTDIMMPHMSGDEMVVELRNIPEMEDIPVLILTARYDEKFRLDMVRSGVHGYLNKPFMVDELLASVHNLLQQGHRTKTRIRESDLRFEAAFDQATVGISLMSPDGRMLRVNQRQCEILGYTAEELLQKNIVDITHPEDIPVTIKNLHEVFSGERDQYFYEKRYHHKNGKIIWGVVSASLLRKEDGSPDYIIAVLEDVTERKLADEIIWRQANFDNLTGLPNRRLLHDRLEQELRKVSQTGKMLAVLSLGLDRFKEINDIYGHATGDNLLCEAAHRISSCVRTSDTVSRLDRDEFILVLSDLEGIYHLDSFTQSLLRAFQQTFTIDGNELFVTVSIGISLFPNDAAESDTLLRNSEQAMYQVKEKGRNGFSYFVSSMQETLQRRQLLIRELRNALAASQLAVYYQPIVELSTNRCFKAEALLRWLHPSIGAISPAVFIPLAEETGLIHEIGDWVFREAVRQAGIWQQLAGQTGRVQISINKSSRQITSGSTDVDWISYLHQIHLPADNIAIEITESLLLDDGDGVMEKLTRFRANGIQFSLDDFGTGYSAMAYLKRFPIDFLKIDQSFVRDMTVDPSDQAIIEAIISMAHKLNIKVIAEGVETDGQRQMLQDAGCDLAQGYFFAKPMPKADFEAFVLQQI